MIDDVLSRFEKVRPSGAGWMATCPAHEDRSPSLSIRFTDDGKILLHCFAGCSFDEIVRAAGLKLAYNKPPTRPDPVALQRRDEARRIAEWARATSGKLSAALREIGDKIRIGGVARKVPGGDRALLIEEEVKLIREWAILCDYDDDLNDPTTVVELYKCRAEIEALVGQLV